MSDPMPKTYRNCGTAPLVLDQGTPQEVFIMPGKEFTATLPPDMEAFLGRIEAIREVKVADPAADPAPKPSFPKAKKSALISEGAHE